MKNLKLGVLAFFACLSMYSSANAQSYLKLRNLTGCDVDIKVIHSASATVCSSGGIIIYVVPLAAGTTQGITIPAGRSVKFVQVVGCLTCGNSAVSSNCNPTWPQTTVGDIDCNSNPVTVDYSNPFEVVLTD